MLKNDQIIYPPNLLNSYLKSSYYITQSMTLPIFTRFKATSYFKAFILNALAATIISVVAIEFRLALEDEKNSYYGFWSNIYDKKKITILDKLILTIISTFVASLLVYHIMYFVFLFGGGQLNLIPTKMATLTELFRERAVI